MLEKDEEMAVNWIAKYVGQSVETIKNAQLKYYRNLEAAYLAGLNAAKPRWHDLRKDKTDLPEKESQFESKLVYISYSDGDTDFAYYEFPHKEWYRLFNDEPTIPPIAWCEIPTFEKEQDNKTLDEELLIKRKQLINAISYLSESLEVLTKLTEGMRHIAANHPTMQSHKEIMQNLRLAEDYEVNLKNILSQGNFGRDEIEKELNKKKAPLYD